MKINFPVICSGLWVYFFRFLAFYVSRGSFWEKSVYLKNACFCEFFQRLSEMFLESWRIFSRRVVKNVFNVSFWGRKCFVKKPFVYSGYWAKAFWTSGKTHSLFLSKMLSTSQEVHSVQNLFSRKTFVLINFFPISSKNNLGLSTDFFDKVVKTAFNVSKENFLRGLFQKTDNFLFI